MEIGFLEKLYAYKAIRIAWMHTRRGTDEYNELIELRNRLFDIVYTECESVDIFTNGGRYLREWAELGFKDE